MNPFEQARQNIARHGYLAASLMEDAAAGDEGVSLEVVERELMALERAVGTLRALAVALASPEARERPPPERLGIGLEIENDGERAVELLSIR